MKALVLLAPLALLAALSTAGCVTRVTVKKVEPGDSTRGIRYSLPATFLVGTPAEDGTISFTFEYLPDENATYAVETTTYMAKHKLDVSIVNGLLQKVESTQNSADVAKAFVDAAGNVQSEVTKDRKKQEAEAAEAAANKAKEAVDAAKQKVTLATAALDAAKLAEIAAEDTLKKAQYALSLAPADNRNTQLIAVRNAEIDRATATAKRTTAEAALAAAEASATALTETAGAPPGGNIGTASGPGNGTAAASSPKPKAWGPVVYRVMTGKDNNVTLVPVTFEVQDDGKIQSKNSTTAKPADGQTQSEKSSTTKPVEGQIQFETSTTVKAPGPEPVAPIFTLASGSVVTLPADGGFGVVEVGMTAEVNKLQKAKLLDAHQVPVDESIPPPLAALHSRTMVKVFLHPETPEGSYVLHIAVEYGDQKSPRPASDDFEIFVRKEAAKK